MPDPLPPGSVIAVAAMARNRVIGCQGRLPWHLPEDFKWFKSLTTGHRLLMGRKTFESIGRPLPGRETIVLSRTGFSAPGVRVIQELSEIVPAADPRCLFICGGAQIYELTLPYCTTLFLTCLRRDVMGDTKFPEFEADFEMLDSPLETPDFQVIHYRNRNPLPWPQMRDEVAV